MKRLGCTLVLVALSAGCGSTHRSASDPVARCIARWNRNITKFRQAEAVAFPHPEKFGANVGEANGHCVVMPLVVGKEAMVFAEPRKPSGPSDFYVAGLVPWNHLGPARRVSNARWTSHLQLVRRTVTPSASRSAPITNAFVSADTHLGAAVTALAAFNAIKGPPFGSMPPAVASVLRSDQAPTNGDTRKVAGAFAAELRPSMEKALKLLTRAKIEGQSAEDAAAKSLGSLVSPAFALSYRRYVRAIAGRATAYARWGTIQRRVLDLMAALGSGQRIHPAWLATWSRDDADARRLAVAADAELHSATVAFGALASHDSKPISAVAKLNPFGFFATVLAKAKRG